jgi:hypothetical protein
MRTDNLWEQFPLIMITILFTKPLVKNKLKLPNNYTFRSGNKFPINPLRLVPYTIQKFASFIPIMTFISF